MISHFDCSGPDCKDRATHIMVIHDRKYVVCEFHLNDILSLPQMQGNVPMDLISILEL